MPYVQPKIEITWDQNLTYEQVTLVKKKVLDRYPGAEFFIIVTNAENISKLILKHHDPIVINNLMKAVSYEFECLE